MMSTPQSDLERTAKTFTGGDDGVQIMARCIDNQNRIFARMQARGMIIRPLKPGWMPPSRPKRWQSPH